MLCTGTGAGDEEMTERGGPSRAELIVRSAWQQGHGGTRRGRHRPARPAGHRHGPARLPDAPRPPGRAPTSQHGQRGHTPPPGHEREPGRDVAPSKHIRLGSWSGARSPPLCVWFCSRPEPALLSGNSLFSYCPILRFLSGQSWSGSSAWSSSDCPRSDSGGRRVLPSLSFPQQHPAQSL